MTFDYIIVGAGSAGCVLAERLSANGRFSVLVLEAGGSDRRFYIHMPLGYGKTFYDPRVKLSRRIGVQQRRPLQSGDRDLDPDVHQRRARRALPSRGGVDGH